MKNIMIDLETLGVTANAVILSIGAVKFDLESDAIDDAGFYASVSIDSNLDADRRIDESTLLWWLKQPAAAQQVFTEPKVTLSQALVDLSDWIGAGDHEVWSNGADFDIPMLNHAYRKAMITTPWAPFSANCVRTYKKLPGARAVQFEKTGVAHNAIADCVNQVRQVQAIYKALFANRPPVSSMIKAKA